MNNVLYKLLTVLLLVVSLSNALRSDPDDNRTFIEIVTSKGYPCEQHFVTTSDGYILQMFRIPYGVAGPTINNRQPVFLQHGLLDSSITWIINEPSESLSYILADAGYDVWMGNNRGNFYSTNHTTLSPTSHAFWQFSFDEMGLIDMPAQLSYVREYVGTDTGNITYIGHSEGTIQAWIGYMSVPEVQQLAPLFIALGPVANVTHITNGALLEMAKYHVDTFFEIFGANRFLPSPTLLRGIFIDFCLVCDECCADVVELICGPHRGAFNDSRMSVVAGHEPSGTSVQNMQHWAQGIRDQQFQAFDYGENGNVQHYNQVRPPIYDVSKFPTNNVKVALVSGGLDELADPTDVATLYSQLPEVVYWQKIANYAHLDYVWALDAHQIIYPNIINLIKKYNS